MGGNSNTADRCRGALLGLAVGDALGTTLEFSRRDSLPRNVDLVGGGPFHLSPGCWTDDTSMALCLADSLIACRAFDGRDVMERFLRWFHDGENSPTGRCFDIGNATRAALQRYASSGDPIAGDTRPDTAGNGSLMRLAPAVLFAGGEPSLAGELARRQSVLTHGAPEAVEACAYFAQLLSEAITGASCESVLRQRPWASSGGRITEIAEGSWRGLSREEISSSGYVVDTLEAALWCVGRHASFEEAVIEAANLGDDADTVGAVTGQLAGALYGSSAIPQRWLEKLAWRERIEGLADALWGLAPSL